MPNVYDYCEAADRIKEDYGLEKALKYLIGEKFYEVLRQRTFLLSQISSIKAEREKPDYNPARKIKLSETKTFEHNLDNDYDKYQNELLRLGEEKVLFIQEIRKMFSKVELAEFLSNIMAFGSAVQHLSPVDYQMWLDKGVLDKTIVDDAEDIFIHKEMKDLLLQ